MIKKLLGVSVIALVASCSEPEITSNEPIGVDGIYAVDGRLVFKDEVTYNQVLDKIGAGNSREFVTALAGLKYRTLGDRLTKADEMDLMSDDLKQFEYYDNAHRMLLNSNAIVQIGNDVVKYHNGVKYYQDVREFGTGNIMASTRTGFYDTFVIPTQSEENNTARAITSVLNRQPGVGGAQYDYFFLGDGSHRKYIHEWVGSMDGNTSIDCQTTTTVRLTVWVKMEGRTKSSRPWTTAPECRRVSWDLSIPDLNLRYVVGGCANGSYVNLAFPNTVSTSAPFFEYSGNYNFLVASTYKTLNRTSSAVSGQWTGNVTGWIQQEYMYNNNQWVWFTWTDTY